MIDNSGILKERLFQGHLSFESLTLVLIDTKVKVISKSSNLESKSSHCVASAFKRYRYVISLK